MEDERIKKIDVVWAQPTPLNDIAPLPYESGGEYKSEDTYESLNWDVPDVYELRNRLLMNLIQSPLLE